LSLAVQVYTHKRH